MEMQEQADDGRIPEQDEPAGDFPWPAGQGESFLDALAKTWSGSVFRPSAFFRSMPHRGPLAAAAAFHAICDLAGAGADLFWTNTLAVAGIAIGDPTGSRDTIVNFVLAVPFGLAVTAMVAILLHAALFTLGAARQPSGVTLRALFYTGGPTFFLVVPVLGLWIAAVWWIVITVIALREVHATSTGRAAAALLLVLFVLSLVLAGVMVVGLVLGVVSR
jgi:hypothetical protein